MEEIILIKYGELSTKKTNRSQFVKTLANNINKKLKGYDYELKYTIDRMYLYTDQITEITTLLKDVFGIYSIVIAYKIPSDLNQIKEASLTLLKSKTFDTFKIETKRNDKTFPLKSIAVSQAVGSYLFENMPNLKVDVNHPDLTLTIELKKEYTYLYTDQMLGSKGYPVSSQSKGLLMLSGGIDSPVAGYMALKRGITIDCIYFESPPHTSIRALNKVEALAKTLTKYQPRIKIHVVPLTKIQETIYKNINQTYGITILRRMMYRISEQIAKENKALVIINGECIGQVASQTLTSISCINEVTTMPVIRPLACFDKEEIINIAKKIGTYETSILPYEDCCTIFVAKHPVINPSIEMCLKYETQIDYQPLIEEAIKNTNTIVINSDDKKEYEGLL